jgi:hypothetical protein
MSARENQAPPSTSSNKNEIAFASFTWRFPGLGLIVATPIVLIMLLVVEIIIVFIAAYLVRLIPIGRLLLGEVKASSSFY